LELDQPAYLFTAAVVKLWHTVDGLFMCVCRVRKVSGHHVTHLCILSWEFITTLDYEWSVIQGRRPYRWTIWVSIVNLGLMQPTAEPQTDVIPATGSLPDARGHTFGSDREHDWL
jgi:hypothetical protein